MKTIPCVGCGAQFPDVTGPTHRYIESSPGCWAAYGEVLAREYGDPAFGRVHRLTVDAYAVQHPGQPSPQSIQSVAVHLMSLCLVLEQGRSMEQATEAIGRAVKGKQDFVWLNPPAGRGAVTVNDVLGTTDAEAHVAMVGQWAKSAWEAWSPHHAQIRAWLGATGILK